MPNTRFTSRIRIYGPSIQVTATPTSTAYTLPNARPRLEIVNRGPATVYAALGTDGTVTVAAPSSSPSSSLLILPGAVLELERVGNTHIAVITDASTSTVTIHQGT